MNYINSVLLAFTLGLLPSLSHSQSNRSKKIAPAPVIQGPKRNYIVNCAIGFSAPAIQMYLYQWSQPFVAGVVATDLDRGIEMIRKALAANAFDALMVGPAATIGLLERTRIVFTEIKSDQTAACVVVEGDLSQTLIQAR